MGASMAGPILLALTVVEVVVAALEQNSKAVTCHQAVIFPSYSEITKTTTKEKKMMVAMMNKIACFQAMCVRRTQRNSKATADIPTTQSAYPQNEFKGIQTDAFFFAGTSEDPPLRPSHPDGSSCGAGCGSS